MPRADGFTVLKKNAIGTYGKADFECHPSLTVELVPHQYVSLHPMPSKREAAGGVGQIITNEAMTLTKRI